MKERWIDGVIYPTRTGVEAIGSIRPTRKWMISVLPVAFNLTNFLRMLFVLNIPYFACMFVTGVLGLLMIFTSRNANRMYVITMSVYIMTDLVCAYVIGNLKITDIMVDLLLFGVTYCLILYPPTMSQGKFAFLVTAMVFFYHQLRGTRRSTITQISSANYFSILIILAVSLYYIALYESGTRITKRNLVPALMSFLIAIWARGRGGIMSCSLMLLGLLLIYLQNVTKKVRNRIIGVLLVIVMVLPIILITQFSLSRWFFSLGRLRTKGLDSSDRVAMWEQYFSVMGEKPIYLLFGVPLENISRIAAKNGNCHNFLFQLHAYNGIVMLVMFLYLVFKAVKYYIQYKKWIPLVLLLVICMRAFTDKFTIGQYGMPILMYFVMKPYFEIAENKKNIQGAAMKRAHSETQLLNSPLLNE